MGRAVKEEANYQLWAVSVLSGYRNLTKRNKMLVKFKQQQLNSKDVYQMRYKDSIRPHGLLEFDAVKPGRT